jgi:hypothetical protein
MANKQPHTPPSPKPLWGFSSRLPGLFRPRLLLILSCTFILLVSACLLVLEFENQNYALRLQLFRPNHYFEKQCYTPLEAATERLNTGQAKDGEEWSFVASRDANNYALNSEQCLAAFPKLFAEIDKSVAQRREANNPITFGEINSRRELGQGMARAMIYQGEVSLGNIYIISY